MNHKPGERHTMPCGCTLEYGEVVRHGKAPTYKRFDQQDVLEVKRTFCPGCKAYNARRTKMAEAIYSTFVANDRDPKERMNAFTREYLSRVQEEVERFQKAERAVARHKKKQERAA